ncbi:MAG: DUF2017 family protein [Actinomycetota bacterium]|jgi:hypothetical protein|nr:DUF2017 family protein [Actinomycetota bacterium]
MKKRILADKSQPGGCVVRLSAPERALLRELPRQIEAMLATIAAGTTGGPGQDSSVVIDAAAEMVGPYGSPEAPMTGSAPVVPSALRRLFPPAYTRDDEAELNYVHMARPGLLEHHREALQTLAETANAKKLDPVQLQRWMTALNDVRLVLGTALDVREDMDAFGGTMPVQMLYYQYLSGLQSELVDFLCSGLPEAVPGADDLIPDDPWGEPLGGLRWDGTPQPGAGP